MSTIIELTEMTENQEIIIAQTLNERIRREVVETCWLGRIVRGFHAFKHEKGGCATTALSVAAAVGTIVFAASVVFSAWGSYKLFEGAYHALSDGKQIPSDIGHAGEWSAQVIMYTYFYSREIVQIMREGDYNKVVSIYQKVIGDMDENENLHALYKHIETNLKGLGAKCFLSKNIFSQKQTTIGLIKEHNPDERLQRVNDVYQAVQEELNTALSPRRYFQRNWKGIKEIGNRHGGWTQTAAILTGIVLPLFLLFQSFLSFVGSARVIEDVIAGDDEISVIGHVGEWPANGIAFAYMAWGLNEWAVKSFGDLVTAKEIIQERIEPYRDDPDPELYHNLVESSNDELQRLRSQCIFSTVPTEYSLS